MINRQMVSVVIPVYNGARTLRDCLISVSNQTYEEYEIIVVDNASADQTKEIILDCQKHNSRIKYAFEPVRGIGRARRHGEALARGEVILMTDADCVVPIDWIKKMVEPIFLQNIDAVQGIENDGCDFNTTGLSEPESIVGRINTNNFAIKKKVINGLDFENADFVRGDDLHLSILLHRNKIRVLWLDVAISHFYEESSLVLIKKHWLAGYLSALLAKKYYHDIKDTDFLAITNQTFWEFFRYFPGIVRLIFVKQASDFKYYLISGFFWRVGLVHFWLENLWLEIRRDKNGI